jgi:co-chaperonin GroES (HSP10)
MDIQASNKSVWVIRDDEVNTMGSIIIPDNAIKKPQSGTIYSVGELVEDKSIIKGKKAYFNQNSGFDIEIEEDVFTVLNDSEILGTCG